MYKIEGGNDNGPFDNMKSERVPCKEGGPNKGKYLRLKLGKDEGGIAALRSSGWFDGLAGHSWTSRAVFSDHELA